MKNKVATSKPVAANSLFESMTREELADTAKALGIPVGKSRANTIANLSKGIASNAVQVKCMFTLSFKPADGSALRKTVFGKTFRTYVSGPGKGNETWLTPAQATEGSPSGAWV